MSRLRSIAALLLATLAACSRDAPTPATPADSSAHASANAPAHAPANGPANAHAPAARNAPEPAPANANAYANAAPVTDLPPNELGRIPVLEYHLIGPEEARWQRTPERFRQDLELLYARGYRPISVSELVDGAIDLPRGASPVVITFDDASPGQFRYIEQDGELVIDPTSAVGVLLDFARTHPDWRNRAVFCMLSNAEAGRSFFGNRGIEGQKDEWRHRKVRFLAEQGFELCNHTLYHAQLSKASDAFAQEQIARLQLAVDSAVPGYRIRTFALPLGLWPKNRDLVRRGSWTDAKTGRTIAYEHDAVLEVAGGPNVSPHDPAFDPLSIDRVQVFAGELEKTLDYLDRSGTRYVSDGDPRTIARRSDSAAATAGTANPPAKR